MEQRQDSPQSDEAWADVVGLIDQHEAEHQLIPSGAVHDAIRRYLKLPEVRVAPTPEVASPPEAPPENMTVPPEALQAPQEEASASELHPDTAAALRLLEMALTAHPEDRAAVTAGLVPSRQQPA
jgi:hypothetical protein